MALTDTAVKKAKPGPKPIKLSDGKGLYLLVNPGGSKLWRCKYRVLGKEKILSLGAMLRAPAPSVRGFGASNWFARSPMATQIPPPVATSNSPTLNAV